MRPHAPETDALALKLSGSVDIGKECFEIVDGRVSSNKYRVMALD